MRTMSTIIVPYIYSEEHDSHTNVNFNKYSKYHDDDEFCVKKNKTANCLHVQRLCISHMNITRLLLLIRIPHIFQCTCKNNNNKNNELI